MPQLFDQFRKIDHSHSSREGGLSRGARFYRYVVFELNAEDVEAGTPISATKSGLLSRHARTLY